MPERGRAPAQPRHARALRRHIPSVLVGVLAVAVAASATLAGIRILRGDEPDVIGRRPTTPQTEPTPYATAARTAPATTPDAGEPAQPTTEPGPTADSAELVVVPVPPAPDGRPAAHDEVARLLDVSAHSGMSVYVDEFRGSGPLHVMDGDGAITDHAVGPAGTSPVAAAVAPDESWIAAVDGSGALWRVPLDGGAPSAISSGSDGLVFWLALDFMSDGRLLATQVGSSSVPLPSRVVIVDPMSAGIEVLSSEEMAYQPTPMDDGSVAYLTTELDGSTVVRRTARGRQMLAVPIGQTAAVDLSRDGRHVVVERVGAVIELVSLPDGRSRALGTGSRPIFSPSGDAIGVVDLAAGRAIELDLGGNEISRTPSLHVAWLNCPEGCAP